MQKVTKVVSKKGAKQVGHVTSRERGELVTLCGIISATGVALPPVYIFSHNNYHSSHAWSTRGISRFSQYSRMDDRPLTFVKVLDHVIKFTGCSTQNPIILTMDNHESHIAQDSLEKAKECGVNIVTLPPHTSNKTQPLDLSVFGPVKTYFNSAANSWMMQHPGKTVTIYEIAKLMGSAWLKAAKPVNILSGFRLAGIWPFDRDVFSSEQFVPSLVTDRPLVAEVLDSSAVCPDVAVSGLETAGTSVSSPLASEASVVPSMSRLLRSSVLRNFASIQRYDVARAREKKCLLFWF